MHGVRFALSAVSRFDFFQRDYNAFLWRGHNGMPIS